MQMYRIVQKTHCTIQTDIRKTSYLPTYAEPVMETVVCDIKD